MDVGRIQRAYGAEPLKPVAKSDKKAAPDKAAAAQKREQVEFSDASMNLQKLKDVIDSTPDVRIKVVDEIRTRIKYNGYPIESNFYKAMQNMVNEKVL